MTYTLNVWLTTDSGRANRTLSVSDTGAWDLQDSFAPALLSGFHHPGHRSGLAVTGTTFFVDNVNGRPVQTSDTRHDVVFVLDDFLLAGGGRPSVRHSSGRMLRPIAQLRLTSNRFTWDLAQVR